MIKHIAENMIDFLFSEKTLRRLTHFLFHILVNKKECILNKELENLLFEE